MNRKQYWEKALLSFGNGEVELPVRDLIIDFGSDFEVIQSLDRDRIRFNRIFEPKPQYTSFLLLSYWWSK